MDLRMKTGCVILKILFQLMSIQWSFNKFSYHISERMNISFISCFNNYISQIFKMFGLTGLCMPSLENMNPIITNTVKAIEDR